MKKIIVLLISVSAVFSISYAQKHSYISIEKGFTTSKMGGQIADNMRTNHLDANIIFWFFDIPINDKHPYQVSYNSNYKIRYGYNFKENASIEGGFGQTLRTKTNGASASYDASGSVVNVNYLDISTRQSTAYIAYMLKNKKGSVAVGIGPAVSFCNVNQEGHYNSASFLTDPNHVSFDKNYVLPGVIITGYWNFVNKKSWFMGIRTDMTITQPVKTEAVTLTNPNDINFITVSKSASIGALTNTFAISAGIKF